MHNNANRVNDSKQYDLGPVTSFRLKIRRQQH